MTTPLISHPYGGYEFLPGIDPYSSGVVANPGMEIVHVNLSGPLPWLVGLQRVRLFLERIGQTRHSLCGVELRCPEPHSMDGFIKFNGRYQQLLQEWEMFVDGLNPVARTNVAPVESPPQETMLFGFSYTRPSDHHCPTFVVAGGGELPHRELDSRHIVRLGDTRTAAMLEKVRCVLGIMQHRLDRLGMKAADISATDVYTAQPLFESLTEVIVAEIDAVPHQGVRWFYARPPIEGIEFEMDLRGVRQENVVDLM